MNVADAIKKPVYSAILWSGYQMYKLSGKTPWAGYIAFRKLFALTHGKVSENYSRKIAKKAGQYSLGNVEGVLGRLSPERVRQITDQIRADGFVDFGATFSAELCDDVEQFARETPARTVPEAPGHELEVFDPANSKAPVYRFSEEDLLANATIRDLVFDPTLLAVAQDFLGCKPISTQVNMWWSAPFGEASSKAAQLYHYDSDWIKFIKFFIYLTDVGPDNGPHCFVKSSNSVKRRYFTEDRRFTDEEVAASYEPQDIVEIKGARGTLLAVDTSGVHKGKPLTEGKRLLFQLEYANSLFGATYEKPEIDDRFTDLEKSILDERRYTYQRFQRPVA